MDRLATGESAEEFANCLAEDPAEWVPQVLDFQDAAQYALSYRLRRVMELRGQGKTFREIGRLFGVSLERTRQIYRQAEKRMQETMPMDGYYG